MPSYLCHFCHRIISGKYYTFELPHIQAKVCLKCFQTLPRCKVCNFPLKKDIEQWDGLCSHCKKKAPQCSICKKPIFGQYMQIQSEKICLSCQKKAPTCYQCKRPLSEYMEVQGKKICLACAQKLEYCHGCQTPLWKQYVQYDGDSRKFCKQCSQKKNLCSVCFMPLGNMFRTMSDQRRICSRCLKTAIKSSNQVKAILKKILPIMQRLFRINISPFTSFHLIDYHTLQKLREKYDTAGRIDKKSLGIFIGKDGALDIYILEYLPYSMCVGTLAHEYTHAWQSENLRSDTDILYIEGLAQWVAYYVLLDMGYTTEADRIPKMTGIYGKGFHKIMKLEKKYGKATLLEKFKQKFGRS